MKDFSFWEEYEGTPEGSGRSEKIWLLLKGYRDYKRG